MFILGGGDEYDELQSVRGLDKVLKEGRDSGMQDRLPANLKSNRR